MPRPPTPTLSPYTEQLPDVNSPATWATRTPLFWNWITGPGYDNFADLVNYSESAIDYVDTALAGSETLIDAVAAIQAQISGRNAIINGNFAINQMAVSGTVTLAAGAYGHDMWKAGTGGCTYTFATSGGVTTITITAGTLLQVIEGANLFTGTYALSFVGTAQGRIGAGSFGASGVTGSVTGGTNLNIEFNTGTVSRVQFEPGSVVTPFERRPTGVELSLCQRYYWRGLPTTNLNFPSYSASSIMAWPVVFPTTMRATPTLSSSLTGITLSAASSVTWDAATITGARFLASASAITANASITFAAGNFLAADARL